MPNWHWNGCEHKQATNQNQLIFACESISDYCKLRMKLNVHCYNKAQQFTRIYDQCWHNYNYKQNVYGDDYGTKPNSPLWTAIFPTSNFAHFRFNRVARLATSRLFFRWPFLIIRYHWPSLVTWNFKEFYSKRSVRGFHRFDVAMRYDAMIASTACDFFPRKIVRHFILPKEVGLLQRV